MLKSSLVDPGAETTAPSTRAAARILRGRWSFLGILLALLIAGRNLNAETLTVSGRGESVVVPGAKKAAADANKRALALAEDAAARDGLELAVATVYGTRAKLGPRADEVIEAVLAHSASLLIDRDVRRADVSGTKAVVELVLKVDGKALRDYLEDGLGLSLIQEAESRFRVFVLSYTVEGQDPDRSAGPVVLKEEVTDEKDNVQKAKQSSTSTKSQTKSQAASLQASAAESDKGSTRVQSDSSVKAKSDSSGSVDARSDATASSRGVASAADALGRAAFAASDSARLSGSLSAQQESSASVDAKASLSGSAAWDQRSSAAIDARSASSGSSYRHEAGSSESYSDTSTRYHKLVVYADPTKKGAGATNEVRAKLGEILKGSGFVTAFADVALMGRDFQNEDGLYGEVLTDMRARPEVKRQDYVAVALNRVTPYSRQPARCTSQIVYRIVRLGDGELLLPDKVVAADSGDQVSEDLARTVATELALSKVDDVLPREIARAMKQLSRADLRETATAVSTYSIRIDNVASPAATRAIKDALRSAGFGATPEFRGEARTESINVNLNGKRGDDVMAIMESLLGPYDVLSMDSKAVVLRAR